MAIQKKHGKGRLDKWYKLAKEKGYRARAAFKLIQLNKKYHELEKSKVLIDLCAAPGVAAEVMPVNSLIVGVDLAPIKPIPRCITFQSDITTPQCRATLRQHLKTWKADTVLHDGAPNVGTAWVQDAFTQAELVLQSLKLATEFLVPGGTFITKIFRSKDYNALLWVFNQLFAKVEATKPPSSRNVSAEIFVVCREFKAPKKIDPRFLDPKTVFAELADPKPNNEARVFNPEKKKRRREGYEEGDYLQHKVALASEFIQTTDPIDMLGSLNELSFEQKDNGDLALATLDRLPETTQEIKICCADLRVLGRKEFKLLLRWRLKVRDIFGFSAKAKKEAAEQRGENEVVEVEPMDEEMQIQEDMQRIKDEADSRKRKMRRKDNDRKRRDLFRMQMNMTTPREIGMEQNESFGEDAVFNLHPLERTGTKDQIARGKMHTVTPKPEVQQASDEEDSESDEEGDSLEAQLDSMYERFREHKMETDAKYRAKKARKEHEDEDFEGFSDRGEVSSDDNIDKDADSDIDSDEEGGAAAPASRDLPEGTQHALSRRAAMFFGQEMFQDIPNMPQGQDSDSGIDMGDSDDHKPRAAALTYKDGAPAGGEDDAASQPFGDTGWNSESEDEGFEVVKSKRNEDDDWTEGPQSSEPMKDGRPDIDIITAEAMTLAQQMARNPQSRQTLVDDSFHRYSHRDVDGLPDWFLDDENQHSRLQRPTTAAAAAAIKEKMRALNARPIKKVREAKARKKMRAAQRLEKLKKKSALLMEEEMNDADKAKAISQLMSKAGKAKKPRRQVSVVVAKGGNRGLSGRPRGVKGKYKMVDARMKKETRALKRAAKKKK